MESKVYIDPYPKTMKMLGLERINIDCGNNTSIVTPANIAKDMVALLPDEVFIPESKFLDICCKSGIFLTSIREKLMNSKAMIESFPDDKERYKYITNNQLFSITPNGQCQMYSVRAVYGTLKVDTPHILCFGVFDQYKTACLNNNHKMLIEEMKKEFGQMKFDVVIGNPPYNKDIYLDFVTLGHTLASKYDCWITPAKWQAKGGQKNEDFRKNIVPYMSKIVYYPYCKDIFDITCHGGITYYLIDKQKHNNSKLSVRHKNEDVFLQDCDAQYSNKAYSLYGDFIEKFIGKIINGNKQHLYVNRKLDGMYKCKILHVYSGNLSGLNCIGGMVIAPMEINMTNDIKSDHYVIYSGKMEECESFKSYLYTKFVRFCLALGVHTQHFNNDEAWRFVPAPEAFDHIFTDQELYKKYDLTDEEINIIESVIKERK